MDLLKENACDDARFKVLEKYILFERAMNFCLVKAEKSLIHQDLKNILADFVKEDTEERSLSQVRKKIRTSGHAFIAEEIF